MSVTFIPKAEDEACTVSTSAPDSAEGIKTHAASPSEWLDALDLFEDANLYQTWAYGETRSGAARVSRLLIKHGAEVVAAAQARLALLPVVKLGIAYVLYGPLWKQNDGTKTDRLREAIRALRSEYVERRGLVLRIVSSVPDPRDGSIQRLFAAEGYTPTPRARQRRTIIMDLRRPLDELSKGLHQKWRYNLKKARARPLEILEGEEEEMFEIFERMYEEMKKRKGLPGLTDLRSYRKIQEALSSSQKLKVFLCRAEGKFCAGSICSTIGDTGIYLFGATSDFGTQTYASYLIHWRMLEWVKSQGCQFYDLNGINSAGNAGGYQFKSQLAGTSGSEIQLAGEFDAYPSALTKMLFSTVASVKAKIRRR